VSASAADVELLIRVESNRALSIGGRLATALGFIATAGTTALAARNSAFWPALAFPVA
jgi:hypothetical protein